MAARSATLSDSVVIASAQSIGRRLHRYPENHFKTIICDEAHRNTLGTYPQAIFARFPSAKVLGLTATPWRMAGGQLGDFYERIVAEVSLKRLVNEGWLSRIVVQSVPLSADLRAVRKTAGDYNDADIGTAIAPHLREAVRLLKTHAKGRTTAVFLPLVALSQEFAALCRAEGLRAVHVDGNDRAGLAAFAAGEFDIISNAALLTTGWDCPRVDCILVLRPTQSAALYSQIVGRGTRLHPGKENLIILDPLYLNEGHDLIKPADLIVSRAKGEPAERVDGDLLDAERDILAERAAKLAREAEAKRQREARTYDPLAESTPWWKRPPSSAQLWTLRKNGIHRAPTTAGEARKLLAGVFAKKAEPVEPFTFISR